jgi:hypothetical protein
MQESRAERGKEILGYALGVVFVGLWFTGCISDFVGGDVGWGVAGFVIPPLGAVRGLYVLRHFIF